MKVTHYNQRSVLFLQVICEHLYMLSLHIWVIREENLLQMVLWKTVHFALFLVKISINFSPGYSTVFFFITVYVSTLQ
jgi:hypothetical protein